MATQSSLQKGLSKALQLIGADFKQLSSSVGQLKTLSTESKTSLVAAINELQEQLASAEMGTRLIDDKAGAEDSKKTYSAAQIRNLLTKLEDRIKQELLGSAPEVLEALKQLSDTLGNNESFATAVAEQLGKRVSYDSAQDLTDEEKEQARSNTGAASIRALQALREEIGDTSVDFVEVYTNAKK